MLDFFLFILDVLDLARNRFCRKIFFVINTALMIIGAIAISKGNQKGGLIFIAIGAVLSSILFLIGEKKEDRF